MSVRALAAGALAGAAFAVASLPVGAGPAARLRRLVRPGEPAGSSRGRATARGSPAGRWRLGAGLVAAAGVAVTVPAPVGLVAALAVAVAVHRAVPSRPGEAGEPAVRAVDLPPVLDLLVACLAAGAPLPAALSVVGETAPAPLGPRLRSAAGGLALGSPPESALAGLVGTPELERLAGVLARAALAGTAPAEQVSAIAEDARREAREAARAAARRVGALVVLPLGLCFLPAFVLLGVVPVVAGVAGRVLP